MVGSGVGEVGYLSEIIVFLVVLGFFFIKGR